MMIALIFDRYITPSTGPGIGPTITGWNPCVDTTDEQLECRDSGEVRFFQSSLSAVGFAAVTMIYPTFTYSTKNELLILIMRRFKSIGIQ